MNTFQYRDVLDISIHQIMCFTKTDFNFGFSVKFTNLIHIHLISTILLQGSLEEQLGRLREYEEAVYQFKPHLEELERINQQIQESFVFENRYTQYTMETLRVGWEQLVTSVNRTINEVENQVIMMCAKFRL